MPALRADNQAPAEPCLQPAEAERLVKEMLDAVNAERAKNKLRPLRLNATLVKVADFYACRLVEGRFFDHVDPFDGSTVSVRAVDFGYAFAKVGENLAAGQQTVSRAMQELMESPKHRANILDPSFTDIGIAVKVGGPFGRYWVQEFGRPIAVGDDAPRPSSASNPPPPAPTSAPSETAVSAAGAK